MRDIVEKWMLECLGCCYSLLRIESEHPHHQVYCLLRGVRYQLAEWGGNEFGECETHSRSKLVTFGPLCLSRTSKNGTSFIDLVSLIVTWEKRPEHIQLSHHGTTCEYVDRGIIVCGPEENFRGPIPPG